MVERFSAVSATHYRDAWLSVIYDATGDYVKSKRALELAEINGLFDPIEYLALAQAACDCPKQCQGPKPGCEHYVSDTSTDRPMEDDCSCGGGDISGHDTQCPYYSVSSQEPKSAPWPQDAIDQEMIEQTSDDWSVSSPAGSSQ